LRNVKLHIIIESKARSFRRKWIEIILNELISTEYMTNLTGHFDLGQDILIWDQLRFGNIKKYERKLLQ
jgi:hypothetical protein